MSPELVIEGRLARITLRDPARRNALDADALCVLREHLATVAGAAGFDGAVDALLLAGEGQAFCAGFDLAACAEEPRRVEPLLSGLSDCVQALRALDVPVVARVQGAALAGGCALLTGCDFVVVAEDAQIGYPTHRIGISPAVSIPSLLSRMGPGARALMMSNEILDGSAAVARGLATHAAPADALDEVCAALVASLLAKGPRAMRETKRLIRTIEERGACDMGPVAPRDAEAMRAARDASMALAAGDEFASMLRAFWSARSGSR
ncbi:MAG: enoyl-CoA hydratase/isomerase family protein [Phycisphaerales bacterium]|jgi:enoyl-CoA hydratase/carnithine racemase